MSQQRFHVPDASLPSTGSARAFVPPLRRYYQGTATSCSPSRRTSFPSLGGATGPRMFSLPSSLRAATAGLGLFARYPLPGKLPWRRQELPSSWGTSISVCTCSPTPDGRLTQTCYETTAWPTLVRRHRRRRRVMFRDSIARLSDSLPTYHAVGCPPTRKARFQVLVRLSWTGFYPQGSNKRFQFTSCVLPPFPSFLAQRTTIIHLAANVRAANMRLSCLLQMTYDNTRRLRTSAPYAQAVRKSRSGARVAVASKRIVWSQELEAGRPKAQCSMSKVQCSMLVTHCSSLVRKPPEGGESWSGPGFAQGSFKVRSRFVQGWKTGQKQADFSIFVMRKNISTATAGDMHQPRGEG
jgi:hypothetical protein